jgi:hypothetical protein
LEAKFKFNSGDVLNHHGHYEVWRAKHGKPKHPVNIALAQALFSEFCAAEDGEKASPEYQNFWHWMLTLIAKPGKPRLPATFRFNIPKILATYDQAVAPIKDAEQVFIAEQLEASMHLVPKELQERLRTQYAPQDNTLQPFIRTILGYFDAEFGPKIVFDMRRT